MTAQTPYLPRIGDGAARARPRMGARAQVRIWWNEIDRVLLGLILSVMALGTVAVAAASPASAQRLSTSAVELPALYFFNAHVGWQMLGILAMLAVSMVPKERARRGSVLMTAAMTVALVLVLIPGIGHEVNGARRWLKLGITIQPSEFLKPAAAVTFAWILSWRLRDPNLPVIWIVTGLFAVMAALLMAQPNLGATILFAAVWFAMVFLSGISMQIVGAIGGLGVALITLAYAFYANARHRIDAFIGGGTAYDQTDLAMRTLLAGGWNGTGFWLGTAKNRLPEAHTDYIFSVIGEEFGLLVCGLIVILYLAIVARVMLRLARGGEDDLFTILAATGLITLLGGQAFINILVNLELAPSKGMTLPLISYGGSSTIATCLNVGLLLAITRRNPFLAREPRSYARRGQNERSLWA